MLCHGVISCLFDGASSRATCSLASTALHELIKHTSPCQNIDTKSAFHDAVKLHCPGSWSLSPMSGVSTIKLECLFTLSETRTGAAEFPAMAVWVWSSSRELIRSGKAGLGERGGIRRRNVASYQLLDSVLRVS
jgi:hypothetical protein